MKLVTIGIPDKMYHSVLESLKKITDITIAEEEDFVLSDSQKEILDNRRKTSSPEDFIPWSEAKKQLKSKHKK